MQKHLSASRSMASTGVSQPAGVLWLPTDSELSSSQSCARSLQSTFLLLGVETLVITSHFSVFF